MSDLVPTSTTHAVTPSQPTSTLRGSDWLRSLSFGDALRQSIILLQHEFRWLVLLFFIGGTGLALVLLPVNSTLELLANQIIQEIVMYPPNFDVLVNLMTVNIMLGTLQTFVVFFGIFLLNSVTIFHVFKKVSTLEVVAKGNQPPQFPTLHIMAAGVVTAALLALANLLLVVVPLVLFFTFFVPTILIIERGSVRQAFSLSVGMRRRHGRRILGALLLGATFIVFTHTLGVHVYLSIEYLFQLFGYSLGIGGPVLLIVITQIPVSMVAPLIPLFSIAFYSGARGAMAEYKHERFTRAVQRHRARTQSLIPLDRTSPDCRQCGMLLRPGVAFCTRCGTPMTPPPDTARSNKGIKQ
jgi:hypothetical protein